MRSSFDEAAVVHTKFVNLPHVQTRSGDKATSLISRFLSPNKSHTVPARSQSVNDQHDLAGDDELANGVKRLKHRKSSALVVRPKSMTPTRASADDFTAYDLSDRRERRKKLLLPGEDVVRTHQAVQERLEKEIHAASRKLDELKFQSTKRVLQIKELESQCQAERGAIRGAMEKEAQTVVLQDRLTRVENNLRDTLHGARSMEFIRERTHQEKIQAEALVDETRAEVAKYISDIETITHQLKIRGGHINDAIGDHKRRQLVEVRQVNKSNFQKELEEMREIAEREAAEKAKYAAKNAKQEAERLAALTKPPPEEDPRMVEARRKMEVYETMFEKLDTMLCETDPDRVLAKFRTQEETRQSWEESVKISEVRLAQLTSLKSELAQQLQDVLLLEERPGSSSSAAADAGVDEAEAIASGMAIGTSDSRLINENLLEFEMCKAREAQAQKKHADVAKLIAHCKGGLASITTRFQKFGIKPSSLAMRVLNGDSDDDPNGQDALSLLHEYDRRVTHVLDRFSAVLAERGTSLAEFQASHRHDFFKGRVLDSLKKDMDFIHSQSQDSAKLRRRMSAAISEDMEQRMRDTAKSFSEGEGESYADDFDEFDESELSPLPSMTSTQRGSQLTRSQTLPTGTFVEHAIRPDTQDTTTSTVTNESLLEFVNRSPTQRNKTSSPTLDRSQTSLSSSLSRSLQRKQLEAALAEPQAGTTANPDLNIRVNPYDTRDDNDSSEDSEDAGPLADRHYFKNRAKKLQTMAAKLAARDERKGAKTRKRAPAV